MCVHAARKIRKDAVVIFDREATENLCATLDRVVAHLSFFHGGVCPAEYSLKKNAT